MQCDLVLGLDCSTTAAKAVVWDLDGNSVSVGRSSYSHSAPHPGWGEQDPNDWWTAAIEAIGKACRKIDPSRLAAMAITHQRETFSYFDGAGYALRPAMLWLDTRATEQVRNFGTDRVHDITGKPPNTATSWYKMAWLGQHEPGCLENTVMVADVHSYLVNKLTGEWHSSTGSVDPLGVLDLKTFDYSSELLGTVGLDRSQFPKLFRPGEVIGQIKNDVADLLGLTQGLQVVAGLGDGQSAGLGVGIVAPGEAYLNLGTGIVSGSFSSDFGIDTSFRTMVGGVPNSYIFETFFGGGTYNLSWFIDNFASIPQSPFGLDLSAEQILETAAANLPVGSDGLLSLPYLTGVLTPYWDSQARGVMFGLSPRHGKAHMYRAILEGLAMEQRLSSSGAEAQSQKINQFLVMGGGARSALWCQIIADVLNRPVDVAREPEATCLGAGLLAAVGAGIFPSVPDAAAAMCGAGVSYHPNETDRLKYDQIYHIYKDIYPALKDHFARLADITSELEQK